MAAKRQSTYRASHPVLRAVLCLILILVILALGVCGLFAYRLNALQKGASFQFQYQFTSLSAEPRAAYTALEQLNAVQGSVQGSFAPDQLSLSLVSLGAEEPFTDLYVTPEETLIDVGQLYRYLTASLRAEYPLADALLPDWELGDYISRTQLKQLLGQETVTDSLQNLSGTVLSPGALRPISPEGGLDGYLYFTLESTEDASVQVVAGLTPDSLFSSTAALHLILVNPEAGLQVQLTGTLSAGPVSLQPPESRMRDEDIAVFAQIRQAIENVLSFVAANAA